MRKIIALSALLVGLGGCQAATVATTTFDPAKAQNTVYALKTTYAAALTVAVAYNQRPRCGQPSSPILCSDAGAIDQIRKADAAASATINSAESAVRSLSANPTVIEAAIAAATNAVDAFKGITAAYSTSK